MEAIRGFKYMNTHTHTHFPWPLTWALCQYQLLHRTQSPIEDPCGAYSAYHPGVSAASSPYRGKDVVVLPLSPWRIRFTHSTLCSCLQGLAIVFCAASTETWERLMEPTQGLRTLSNLTHHQLAGFSRVPLDCETAQRHQQR